MNLSQGPTLALPAPEAGLSRSTLWSKLDTVPDDMRSPETDRRRATETLSKRRMSVAKLRDRGIRPPSRFTSRTSKDFVPPTLIDIPSTVGPSRFGYFVRESRLEDLTRKIRRGELELGPTDLRPPSPIPQFGATGSRINSRESRARESMLSESNVLMAWFLQRCGSQPGGWFRPPIDYQPAKRVVRILIPQDKYSEYNFMGLIIGPRGQNHKRLESESGAQVSIRGQGTVKEGKKTEYQTDAEAQMPQHVHITADSDKAITRAMELIEPLLDPLHPLHEYHKRRGVIENAIVNTGGHGLAGKLGRSQRDFTAHSLAMAGSRCEICGSVGHFSWRCPVKEEFQYERAVVQCALCEDKGHPTMDCKFVKYKKITKRQVEALEAKAKERRQQKYSESRLDQIESELRKRPAPTTSNERLAALTDGRKREYRNLVASDEDDLSHLDGPKRMQRSVVGTGYESTATAGYAGVTGAVSAGPNTYTGFGSGKK